VQKIKTKFYGLYKAITVPTFEMTENEVLKCGRIQDMQLHDLNRHY
jgi:hypothetical protein